MSISTVCAIFSDTRKGRLALTVAANLVRRLNIPSLGVYLRDDCDEASLVTGTEHALTVSDSQLQRVLNSVMATTGLTADRITFSPFEQESEPSFPADALVV